MIARGLGMLKYFDFLDRFLEGNLTKYAKGSQKQQIAANRERNGTENSIIFSLSLS